MRIKRQYSRGALLGLVLPVAVGSLALSLGCGGGDGGSEVHSGGRTGSGGGAGEAGAGAGGGPADDCDRDVRGATEVKASISSDTTWEGKVLVSGKLTVDGGATLTIKPGTQVIMNVDSSLHIAGNFSTATLNAEGTAAAPIRFCGRQERAGYWGSLRIGGTGGAELTSDSVLSHVLIADAGGAGADAAFVQLEELTVRDVAVRNSGKDGVHAFAFGEGSERLSVEGSTGAPVVLLGALAADRFPLGGDLRGNGEDLIRARFDGIDTDVVIHDLGLPYLQEQSLTIGGEHSLTYEAGVEYRFARYAFFEVGWNFSSPRLLVQGTAAKPVVFRGEESEPGSWEGLTVRGDVSTDSKLSYLELRDAGGGDTPPLEIAAPITVDHVTLDGNARAAVIGKSGLAEDSTTLVIKGSEEHPLTVEASAMLTLPVDGAFTDNAEDVISVAGGGFEELKGTIPNPGVPYRMDASVSSTGASELTIEAGCEFIMTADVLFEIGWNSGASKLTAVGTARNPIIFRGAEDEPGFWRGIRIGGRVKSDSIIDHVEIGNAGQGSGNVGNLYLGTAITVTNSRFYSSAGYGIVADRDDTADYTDGNTFECVASGEVGRY